MGEPGAQNSLKSSLSYSPLKISAIASRHSVITMMRCGISNLNR